MSKHRLHPLSDLGLLTIAEVAERKGRHAVTVQRWIAEGLIDYYVTPGTRPIYLFREADVTAFVAPVAGRPKKVGKKGRAKK